MDCNEQHRYCLVTCAEPKGHEDLHHGEVNGSEVMWAEDGGTVWTVNGGQTYWVPA